MPFWLCRRPDAGGGRGKERSRLRKIMNRKRVLLALALGLLLVLFCASALAADDPLTISMALETIEFAAPKEITVNISVTNAGESDLPGIYVLKNTLNTV